MSLDSLDHYSRTKQTVRVECKLRELTVGNPGGRRSMRLILFILLLAGSLAQAEEQIKVNGAELDISFESEFDIKEQQTVTRWLLRYSQALAGLYGQFPLKRARYQVYRAGHGKGPVPWAEVRRQGVEGVNFYLGGSFNAYDLMNDWTAAHELSHLLIPYPGKSDIWLSEGLASWYQGILMFNAGFKSEQALWQGLIDGFERAGNTRSIGSLSQSSRQMKSQHSYMRVYWVGAAYFLQMEYALQQHDEQLLAVLMRYQACCRVGRSYESGVAFVTAMDEQMGISLFRYYYDKWRDSEALPDMSSALAWFGVSIERGEVVLDDGHVSAMRRAQLYRYPVEVPKSRQIAAR